MPDGNVYSLSAAASARVRREVDPPADTLTDGIADSLKVPGTLFAAESSSLECAEGLLPAWGLEAPRLQP
jgi:hypothetical protein